MVWPAFKKLRNMMAFLSVLMQTDPHYVRTISVILFLQGGTLIEYEGKQRLLEIAQVPKEHVSTKM